MAGKKKLKGKALRPPSSKPLPVQLKNGKNGGKNWKVEDQVQVRFNEHFGSEDFKSAASEAWTSTEQPTSASTEPVEIIPGKCQLYKSPFNCMKLKGLLKEADADRLKSELLSLDFCEKSNDLYKFRQSAGDLATATGAAVSALRSFIYGPFRDWLAHVTGIELNSTVDMSCAQYGHTDVLLCHDDELEGRRIAYILYLVDEDWSEMDGGGLDLFGLDANGQPDKVTATVRPEWNSLAFFAVTPTSFHQVAEVLSSDKCRLSVSGWFHGKPITRPPPYLEPPKELSRPGDMDEEEFYTWINPSYLDPSTQGDVQESFCDKSEIQLQDFLQPDKYGALREALLNLPASSWVDQGPANKRRYQTALDGQDGIIQKARQFFHSEAFYLVLSNLTGLKLHRLASTPSSSEDESDEGPKEPKEKKQKKDGNEGFDPCCKLQLTRWTSGSYTLLNDQEAVEEECGALDLWLFLSADNWLLEHGGQVSYIARGEDEELLTVCPSNNCLALVYRDADTIRFVKHINSKSGDLVHFSLDGVYYDKPPVRTTIKSD